MFKRFFKPKWQHINADIRREAVTKLNSDNAEDYQIIKDLARFDESVEVRCAAIEKINNISDLLSLLGSAKDVATIEDGLNHRISVLLCNSLESPLEDKLSVLNQLNEPSVFRYVVKNGQQVELQVAAAEQITDEETLEQLALHAKSVKVRQKAVAQISSPSHLKLIEQETKSKDKSVFKIARDRLAEQRDDIERQQEQAQATLQALEAVEKHASAPVEPLYEHKLQFITKQWLARAVEQREPFEERWRSAVATCERALEEWRSRDFEDDDVVSEENAIQEQQEAIKVMRDVVTLVELETDLLQLDLPALQGVLSTQQVRWENATQYVEASSEDAKSFERLLADIKRYVEPTRKLKNLASKIETVLASVADIENFGFQELKRSIATISQLEKQLNWPSHLPKHPLIASLEQSTDLLKQALDRMTQQTQVESDAIKTMLLTLETHLEQGKVKRSQQLLNQIQSRLQRIDAKKGMQFEAPLKRLQIQFRELKDWQGYASTPKKEALLDSMKALIGDELSPPDKAEKIKELQSSWKTLGPAEAGRERELWKAFKAAGDEAFEPCRIYFQEQAKKREDNLNQRIKLCEQLETYEEKNDWGRADWPAVLETIITAKAAWRRFSPVENKANKSVQARFNEVTAQIQKRLDDERSRNSRLKEKLIQSATALLDKEDLNDAVLRAKALQKEWKAIGISHRKQDEAHWKSFRAICDQLFAKRSAEKEVDQATRIQHQKQFEDVCTKLEGMLQHQDEKILEMKSDVNILQAEIESIGALPVDRANALRTRWKNVFAKVSLKMEQAKTKEVEKGYLRMWDKAGLCASLERKLLEDTLSDTDLVEIKDQWIALGDLPTGAEAALNARFDLGISLIGQQSEMADKLQAMTQRNGQVCRKLVIQAEILAGIDSTDEDQQLRMQLQVDRLSSGMQSRAEKKQEAQAVIERREIEIEWCANGPIKPAELARYEGRFKAALEKLSA